MKKTFILLLGFCFYLNEASGSFSEKNYHEYHSSEDEPLLCVYRNPENQFTRIEFWDEAIGQINIDIMNARGVLIERIPKEYDKEGLKIVELDTRYFRPGVYFVRVNKAVMKFLIAWAWQAQKKPQ